MARQPNCSETLEMELKVLWIFTPSSHIVNWDTHGPWLLFVIKWQGHFTIPTE